MTTVEQVNTDKSIKKYFNVNSRKTMSRKELSDLALSKVLQLEKSMDISLAIARTDEFLRDWIPT